MNHQGDLDVTTGSTIILERRSEIHLTSSFEDKILTSIQLKYVHKFKDRHGKVRHYMRRPGCKQISLPGKPGSSEFMAAYQAALLGEAHRAIASARISSGSLDAAVLAYYKSTEFKRLAPKTQVLRRGELERFRSLRLDGQKSGNRCGALPIGLLDWQHMDAIIADKSDRPGACDNFLRATRGLFKYCIKAKLVSADPTRGITPPPLGKEGRHTWTEQEIALFEETYPIGTRERLAFALALHTALRREDLIVVGPEHIRDNTLHIRPKKTERSTAVVLAIPIDEALRVVLEAVRHNSRTFITVRDGAPMSEGYFTTWFGAACQEAGLPAGCSVHGLRKAACRRLAEAGCSAHEIMSISGHTTLREVQRYTEAAERAQMAKNAAEKINKRRMANREQRFAK
jgi:integrase